MALESFTVDIYGLEGLNRAMKDFDAKMRRTVLRRALREIGKPMVRTAKSLAPVLQNPGKFRMNKIPGMLKQNIRLLTSKVLKQRDGDFGVFLASGKRKGARYGKPGRSNPFDTYYWVFMEHPFGKYVVPGAKYKQYLLPAFNAHEQQMITQFSDILRQEINRANSKSK